MRTTVRLFPKRFSPNFTKDQNALLNILNRILWADKDFLKRHLRWRLRDPINTQTLQRLSANLSETDAKLLQNPINYEASIYLSAVLPEREARRLKKIFKPYIPISCYHPKPRLIEPTDEPFDLKKGNKIITIIIPQSRFSHVYNFIVIVNQLLSSKPAIQIPSINRKGEETPPSVKATMLFFRPFQNQFFDDQKLLLEFLNLLLHQNSFFKNLQWELKTREPLFNYLYFSSSLTEEAINEFEKIYAYIFSEFYYQKRPMDNGSDHTLLTVVINQKRFEEIYNAICNILSGDKNEDVYIPESSDEEFPSPPLEEPPHPQLSAVQFLPFTLESEDSLYDDVNLSPLSF